MGGLQKGGQEAPWGEGEGGGRTSDMVGGRGWRRRREDHRAASQGSRAAS